MNNVIELESVTKKYRRGGETVMAVDGVTLSVPEGDFAAITGPSGSGKTTLLNLIGCVDKPSTGVVRIDGATANELNEHALTRIRAEKVGFVFQQFFLLPTLTVEENVQLPALFLGKDGNAGKRAAELLKIVGLADRAKHLPGQISGGEMQRVAIPRALINRPRILLADEPTGNLDSHNARVIVDIFRELNQDGLTILMVTHNGDLARQAARTIHLKDGKTVAA